MMTAEEAREMYLSNHNLAVKSQTEQLIATIENSIIYACENGEHYIVIDTTKYRKDAIQNVTEFLKEYGYSFCDDYNCIEISW